MLAHSIATKTKVPVTTLTLRLTPADSPDPLGADVASIDTGGLVGGVGVGANVDEESVSSVAPRHSG